MCNEFVDYLNSLNNVSSNNENAMAEAQILNKFYEKIRVDRNIGIHIYERLFSNEPRCVILTGHAGDGKTSILVQILSKIGYFNQGMKALKETEYVSSHRQLLYVKDMSELNEQSQEHYLKLCLTSPNSGISSILVSNTGPLINTIKRLSRKNTQQTIQDWNELESRFLDAIDNELKEDFDIDIADNKCKFDLINLAKIDNSYFVKEILDRVLEKSLWEKCESCKACAAGRCPIYENYQNLVESYDSILDVVQRIYFWLSESETRLTIRQMFSHICYSITGNLTCKKILASVNEDNSFIFKYNFANLFFGYIGIDENKESINIKAIRELKKIGLDYKSIISVENKLFVKEDFSGFNDRIRLVIEEEIKNLYNFEGDDNNQQFRRALRRYNLLFSLNKNSENTNSENTNEIYTNVFSEVFPLYYRVITETPLKKSDEGIIKTIVFEGLYKLFTGVNYNNNENVCSLTLKKNINEVQTVQMILGNIKRDDIQIFTKLIKTSDTCLKKNILYIKIKNVDFELTLEILDFLFKLKSGYVFTNNSPDYTYGILKLKSDLSRVFKSDKTDIRLNVITSKKIEKINIYFEDGKLYAQNGGW